MTTLTPAIKASALGLFLLLGSTAIGQAQQAAAYPVASAPIAASGEARAPYAWNDLCQRSPAMCRVNTQEAEQVELTPKLWKAILAINTKANREIEAVTDQDHWGVVDRWDLPEDGRGDCEDFALLKRKRLVEAGVPRRALLMTVVIDEENAGHAVLMVRTDHGDFILDNKRNAVLPWNQTGYIYIKRESQVRTGWTSLGGLATPAIASAR